MSDDKATDWNGEETKLGKTFNCPVPLIAPFGLEVDAASVQQVWDAYIKPGDETGQFDSMEGRTLKAILRAVYAGMMPTTDKPVPR